MLRGALESRFAFKQELVKIFLETLLGLFTSIEEQELINHITDSADHFLQDLLPT